MEVNSTLLNEYIERSGLKTSFICDALGGISPSTFSRKVNNDRAFKYEEVIKLCALLKIPNAERSKIFLVEM